MPPLSISTPNPMPLFQETPRWDDLLKTNEPPHHAELAIVELIRKSARNELTLIVQAAGQDNTQDPDWSRWAYRDEQEELLQNCKTILAPVRRVPREVISEIFLHALGHYDGTPTAATLKTAEGPWALGQVCRIWREVVRSYPQFWSSMQIAYDVWPGTIIPRPIQDAPALMDALLQLSGEGPLRGEFSDTELDLEPILEDNSYRWTDLKFTCEYPQMLAQINASVGEEGLSALESLTLAIAPALSAYRHHYNKPHPKLSVFRNAPLLRRLVIAFSAFGYESLDRILARFPWEQITHYEGPVLLEALPRFSGLVNAYIADTDDTISDMLPTTIVLPEVCTLRVDDVNTLTIFTLPALLKLHIDQPPHSHLGLGRLSKLRRMLLRSNCSLQVLVIGELSRELIEALRLMPGLTTLCISSQTYDDDLLRALIPNASGTTGAFLPHLKVLAMNVQICRRLRYTSGAGVHSTMYKPILDMVESRCTSVCPIDDCGQSIVRLERFHFALCFCCWTDIDHRMPFEALRSKLETKLDEPDIKISVSKAGKCQILGD